MAKTDAQLEAEIAELSKNPKIGDPAWERSWADLLRARHSKARTPTVDEIARAISYIEGQYVVGDGEITGEQPAEGLTFGQKWPVDADCRRKANEAQANLSRADWLRIAERANFLAEREGLGAKYMK